MSERAVRTRPAGHAGWLEAALEAPALAPLRRDTQVTTQPVDTSIALRLAAPAHLIVSPGLAGRAGRDTLLRFGLELARLATLPRLAPAAALLLAARAAATALATQPGPSRRAAAEDPLAPLFDRFATTPPLAELPGLWRALSAAWPGPPPDAGALDQALALWRLGAATEALLLAGGDDRLLLDPETGRNRYHCLPVPCPGIIALGSCTASTISSDGFAAADAARLALLREAAGSTPRLVVARATARLADDIGAAFGAGGLADTILAASGTDAALLATGLLAAEHPGQPLTSVLMAAEETGSGVPDAVRGRHFAPCAASGEPVRKGEAVDGFPGGLALRTVRLRDEAGAMLDAATVRAEIEAAVREALPRGRVVLHAIEGSKTGLSAPGTDATAALAAAYPGRVDVVVDACQARVSPTRVREWLSRGWPVLVTGSKFMGAPGFCGAVLFPRARLRAIAGHGRVPRGLAAYADLADGIAGRRCAGLLLRWEAAMPALRAFRAVPEPDVARRLARAGAALRAAILRHPALRLLPGAAPGLAWDRLPSVFTFQLVPPGRPALSAAELRARHMALAQLGIAIGQPVLLGGGDQAGLRLALGASDIVAGADPGPAAELVCARIAAE